MSDWTWAAIGFGVACLVLSALVAAAHWVFAHLEEQERQEYDRGRGNGVDR